MARCTMHCGVEKARWVGEVGELTSLQTQLKTQTFWRFVEFLAAFLLSPLPWLEDLAKAGELAFAFWGRGAVSRAACLSHHRAVVLLTFIIWNESDNAIQVSSQRTKRWYNVIKFYFWVVFSIYWTRIFDKGQASTRQTIDSFWSVTKGLTTCFVFEGSFLRH